MMELIFELLEITGIIIAASLVMGALISMPIIINVFIEFCDMLFNKIRDNKINKRNK